MSEETQVTGSSEPQISNQEQVTPSVEITEDAVKQHPLYKQVLEESISRRLALKELKAQLEKVTSQDEPKRELPQKQGEEVPSWAAQLMERISGLETQIVQEKSASFKAQVAQKYGISSEDAELFLTASDPTQLENQAKKLAERLGTKKFQDPTSPGNGSGGENANMASLRQKLERLMKGEQDESVFDVGYAQRTGGGVIR